MGRYPRAGRQSGSGHVALRADRKSKGETDTRKGTYPVLIRFSAPILIFAESTEFIALTSGPNAGKLTRVSRCYVAPAGRIKRLCDGGSMPPMRRGIKNYLRKYRKHEVEA